MFSDQADLYYRFGVALFIGILVGLEREHAADVADKKQFAGVRTFALLGLLGCTSALLNEISGSPWPLVAILVGSAGLFVIAYSALSRANEYGATTQVAALLTVLCGALVYWNYAALATAITVTMTVLLSLKSATANFARQIRSEDIYATLKFAVITAIVLPVLPNETFGPPPFNALNPYRVWLMVVFISGISFAGYVLIQVISPRRGIGLTGLLGGLVSSTAVTLGFVQRGRENSRLTDSFTLAISLAWVVMFLRVIGVVAVINGALLRVVWLPLAAAAVALLGYCAYLYWRGDDSHSEEVDLTNPFSLGPALAFGALYAVVLLVASSAELYFGTAGIYTSSVLAGLVDVNAITISMAELSGQAGDISLETGATAISLAVISNTVVKAGLVIVSGTNRMRRMILPSALAAIGVTIAATWLV